MDDSYQKLRILQHLERPLERETNLEELYKLVKTNEDLSDDDIDSDQRANDLFNSMIRKGDHSEDLNLLAESFDNDSVDLSERHLNDEQFKLVTKAFSQIQTMLQINGRHEGEVDGSPKKKFVVRRPAAAMKQLGGPENLFDSKGQEEKPKVNLTATKKLILQKPPLSGGFVTPPAGTPSEQNTLKKTFQPPPFKSIKSLLQQSEAESKSTADNSLAVP